jgi:hypothetical protein
VVEEFFITRKRPWPIERSLLVAELLELFGKPASRTGNRVQL